MSENDLVRPAMVAKILDVAPSTVYYWIATGKLEGVKLPGKTLRVKRSIVDEMQNNSTLK